LKDEHFTCSLYLLIFKKESLYFLLFKKRKNPYKFLPRRKETIPPNKNWNSEEPVWWMGMQALLDRWINTRRDT